MLAGLAGRDRIVPAVISIGHDRIVSGVLPGQIIAVIGRIAVHVRGQDRPSSEPEFSSEPGVNVVADMRTN